VVVVGKGGETGSDIRGDEKSKRVKNTSRQSPLPFDGFFDSNANACTEGTYGDSSDHTADRLFSGSIFDLFEFRFFGTFKHA